MSILYQVFDYNPLYNIVANDIMFGLVVLYLVRDNRQKMDKMYKKWDRKRRRTESDRLDLDKTD